VPAEGNGNLQTLICVLVARPRRCLTLSNTVPWQNWMVAYLGYTLRMRTLFHGWPIMVNDTHTRRRSIIPPHLQQHLRSAAQRLLVVPRHQLSSYGRRAFCVAGPSVWNSLPDNLRNPIIGGNSFRQSLKTFLFATYWCIQRIRGFTSMRYINRLFTFYLLTPRGSVRAQ